MLLCPGTTPLMDAEAAIWALSIAGSAALPVAKRSRDCDCEARASIFSCSPFVSAARRNARSQPHTYAFKRNAVLDTEHAAILLPALPVSEQASEDFVQAGRREDAAACSVLLVWQRPGPISLASCRELDVGVSPSTCSETI